VNNLLMAVTWSMGPLSQTAEAAVMLFAVGLVLVVAEVLLPTHGVLGMLGALSVLGGVIACTVISPIIGLSVMLGLVIVTPFAWTAFVKFWPRTAVGRRMFLSEVSGKVSAQRVGVGQMGLTLSELRPMGECEFDGIVVEAISEEGLIAAGSRVKVVALSDHRPVVQTAAAAVQGSTEFSRK